MRYSDVFGKTRREAPAEIVDPAGRLAYRAGLLLRREGEVNVYLPLATRTLEKMELRLREGLRELRAQELRVIADLDLSNLAAQQVQSYKHLPARLAWSSAGGTGWQLVGLDATVGAAQETARRFEQLAAGFFEWAEVPCATAEDVENSQVWCAPAEKGDLEILHCSNGDYIATRAAARANKPRVEPEPLRLREEVATPHCDTIDSLAQFLGVPTTRTAKAVFYSSDGRVIFAVIRGDLQIDEEKLVRACAIKQLRFATDDEIARVGATPGYASPVGVHGATIVVDDSIVNSTNLVAGANREGYHSLNTNVPRDYKPDVVTDIALARPGDACPNGDGKLEVARGIALGQRTQAVELDARFLDGNGRAQKSIGITAEIDLAQTLLAFIAAHHDDKGIVWSRALAPFPLQIVALNADKPEVAAAIARVMQDLERAGIEYLLDDRAESAGVKFNDADLIGLPLRVTIGPRTVAQGAVEVKRRDEVAARVAPLDQVTSFL